MEKMNSLTKIIVFGWWSFYTPFLFTMTIFPNQYLEIKYGLLIGVAFFSIVYAKKKDFLRFKVLGFLLIWYIFFGFSYIYGVLSGFESSAVSLRIWFVTPIATLLVSNFIDSPDKYKILDRLIIICSVVIVAWDLLFILSTLGYIPRNDIIDAVQSNLDFYENVDISDAMHPFRISNQTSLMFMLPYLITHMTFNKRIGKWRRIFYALIVVVGCIEAAISARRALQISVFIGIVVVSFFVYYIKGKKAVISFLKKITMLILMLVCLMIMWIWSNDINYFYEWLIESFLEPFKGESDSAMQRTVQAHYLLINWYESPLFGKGLTSYAVDYVRGGSLPTPFSYEWVYLSWLMQIGILGIGIVFSLVIILLYSLYKKYLFTHNVMFVSMFVGFFCLFLAGSSNPFITSLWIWTLVGIGIGRDRENDCKNE